MCNDDPKKIYKSITQTDFDVHLKNHDSYLSNKNPDGKLEAKGYDLREISFDNHSLCKALFQNCNLSGKDFSDTNLVACQFRNCDLTNTKFTDLDLEGTHFIEKSLLSGSVFRKVNNKGTVYHQIDLTDVKFINCKFLDGDNQTRFTQCTFNEMDFTNITLKNVRFSNSTLIKTHFSQAKLFKVHFNNKTTVDNCNFINTKFHDPKLQPNSGFHDVTIDSCNFDNSDLRHVIFKSTRIINKTTFINCDLSNTSLNHITIDGSDFTNAKGLYGRHCTKMLFIQGDVNARYGYWFDIFNWSKIRNIGSLKLFGVSYFAIIAVILWTSGTRWYNEQIVAMQLNETIQDFSYVDNLNTIQIPTETKIMFIALFLLAIGTSIYKFTCPKEIQENTETHWDLTLKKQLMEYLSLSYCKIGWRWPCGICYILGGGWILGHIIYRIGITLKYMFNP